MIIAQLKHVDVTQSITHNVHVTVKTISNIQIILNMLKG